MADPESACFCGPQKSQRFQLKRGNTSGAFVQIHLAKRLFGWQMLGPGIRFCDSRIEHQHLPWTLYCFVFTIANEALGEPSCWPQTCAIPRVKPPDLGKGLSLVTKSSSHVGWWHTCGATAALFPPVRSMQVDEKKTRRLSTTSSSCRLHRDEPHGCASSASSYR